MPPPGPPAFVAKPKVIDGRCSKHPRYEGAKSPPTMPCEACWRIFLRQRFGHKVRPLDTSIVVVANEPQELDSFLDALKGARDKNAHSGGGYAAFFHAKDGRVIQFDVQVPIMARPEGRKWAAKAHKS